MGKDPEVITVTELRNLTREVIENAHFRGRQYVVERAGQPMVVILGVDDYERMIAQRDRQAATHSALSSTQGSAGLNIIKA